MSDREKTMSWLASPKVGTTIRDANIKRKGGDLRLMAIAPAIIMCLVLLGCGAEATPVPVPLETSSAVSFSTEDGVEIRGRLFGQGQRGVVLAHMYPADQRSWWEFAQVLAEKGYMTLTFDFRGYGDSGGNKEIKLIDRDVEAALEFLRTQGASTVFLIGASMGGTTALKVAARQTVAGVVSLSAPVELRGISVKGERVLVPALLMATEGDVSAKRSLESMLDGGIVGELTESVVYEEGDDHGTDILRGKNADGARERILSFLETNVP